MKRFIGYAGPAVFAFILGWALPHRSQPAKPPTIEELRELGWTPPSDHDRDVIRRNTEFNSARSVIRHDHPDNPRRIEFPEVPTNPVLWDFTLHSVLRGEKRTWTWGDTGFVAFPGITASTVGTGSTTYSTWGAMTCSTFPSTSTYAVFPRLNPAASGGRP